MASILTAIGLAVAALLAAERVPRALASLIRSCVPVIRAVAELRRAIDHEIACRRCPHGTNTGAREDQPVDTPAVRT